VEGVVMQEDMQAVRRFLADAVGEGFGVVQVKWVLMMSL